MKQLENKIQLYIKNNGPISFEHFMDFALYDEQYGYYTKNIENIGKTGDFYTSPAVHSAFGEVVTNFIIKGISVIDAPQVYIVEIGSGNGYLTLDILDCLKATSPGLYNRIKYICTEVSDKCFESSKKLLKDHISKLIFHESINNIEKNLSGFVISNELFDAIPFHRIKFKGGGAKEIFITIKDNSFVEILREIKDPAVNEHIGKLDLEFADGQQIEINTRYDNLIGEISKILHRGFLLTFDYGYLKSELYNPGRFNGTFRCFYKHRLSDNPYENIGHQDITCSVDFSSVIDLGSKHGLKTIKYTTQGQYLVDWGILNIMERATEQDRTKIKNLILPTAMGDKFKALVQSTATTLLPDDFYPESDFRISHLTSNDRLRD